MAYLPLALLGYQAAPNLGDWFLMQPTADEVGRIRCLLARDCPAHNRRG